ncbi:MAG: transposase, partial [Nitrososphaerota archaeon]|nr:transposase [Nitrososphaerota archaeon]
SRSLTSTMSQEADAVARQALEKAIREEHDADLRLRTLLVLKVKYDGIGQNQAARELHAQSSWAVTWARRFEEEGIEGLRTRPRSGRPPKVEQRMLARIGREVATNESGWTVKEVRQLVQEEAGVTYSERHVLRLIHRWGARSVVPEKRLAHKASLEERLAFKKGLPGS